MPLSLLLIDKQKTLPNRHYTLLCHLLSGTEDTLGYFPGPLRAYKAENYYEMSSKTVGTNYTATYTSSNKS